MMEPTLVAAPAEDGVPQRHRVHAQKFSAGWPPARPRAWLSMPVKSHATNSKSSTLTIKLPRLPDAFAGMKIVQISDFHFQEYTEAAFLEAVVRRVNELAPELVVLTGDFVSNKPLPKHFGIKLGYHCAEILSRIECPLRYAILGNHDVLVSSRAVTDALHTHGIPVLANSFCTPRARRPAHLARRHQGCSACRSRIWTPLSPPAGIPTVNQSSCWSHEPDFADHAVGRQIDLILSGHTHGGQILLPFLPPLLLPDMGIKYVHGLFRLRDGMQLYVNRGIGAVNLPFRFRCPPEITVITLQPRLVIAAIRQSATPDAKYRTDALPN